MLKPKNYDTIQGYTSFNPLPPGGYVCQIKKIEKTTSKSGTAMLNIYLDIHEGEYMGYYEHNYRSNTRENKRWGCIVYQTIYDQHNHCNRGLKTFCEAVEASNNGFNVEESWGEKFCDNYKGQLIGGVFRREQYLNKNDEEKWVTRCFAFRKVEDIYNGIEVPNDKFLDNSYAPANTFKELGLDDTTLPF